VEADVSGSPAEPVASAPVLAGRYHLGDEIGRRAGRAVLWRARDAVLQRDVAVMTPCSESPDATERDRFERDVAGFARLDHPALPRVFDGGVESDRPYLVVELIHGETVAELLRRGPLDAVAITDLGLTLTDVLEHVRCRGAGHVDATPETVLVADDGRVRVSGIGVVLAPDGDEGRAGAGCLTPLADAVGAAGGPGAGVVALRELFSAATRDPVDPRTLAEARARLQGFAADVARGRVVEVTTAEHATFSSPMTRPEGWPVAGLARLTPRLTPRRKGAVTVTVAAAALGAVVVVVPMLPTGSDPGRRGPGAVAVIGPDPAPTSADERAGAKATATAVPVAGPAAGAGGPAAEAKDDKGPQPEDKADKGKDGKDEDGKDEDGEKGKKKTPKPDRP
jgi:hypothetical protein